MLEKIRFWFVFIFEYGFRVQNKLCVWVQPHSSFSLKTYKRVIVLHFIKSPAATVNENCYLLPVQVVPLRSEVLLTSSKLVGLCKKRCVGLDGLRERIVMCFKQTAKLLSV